MKEGVSGFDWPSREMKEGVSGLRITRQGNEGNGIKPGDSRRWSEEKVSGLGWKMGRKEKGGDRIWQSI